MKFLKEVYIEMKVVVCTIVHIVNCPQTRSAMLRIMWNPSMYLPKVLLVANVMLFVKLGKL